MRANRTEYLFSVNTRQNACATATGAERSLTTDA